MASRYLKIPVIQRVQTEAGEANVSYSKVLKTLRIPQEFLGTSTGSLYLSDNESSDSNGTPAPLEELVTQQFKNFNDLMDGGALFEGADAGFWMQIPLNVSKTLWQSTDVSPIGGDDADNFLEYNGALWLRISQEVVYKPDDPKGVGTFGTNVWYTYPFLSDLYKQNNSAYELRVEDDKVYVGNKGYNQVQKLLQDKLQKALVSNPGAKETLLDFGKTDENLSAGQWECQTAASLVAAGLDPNDIVLLNQQYPSTEASRNFVNSECRLVVTCAVITNRGQGVGSADVVDAIQSYPTLAETWGISTRFYDDSHLAAQQANGEGDLAQEINLNPAQLFSDGVTIFEQFLGRNEFTSKTIDSKCCESFTTGPIKGK